MPYDPEFVIRGLHIDVNKVYKVLTSYKMNYHVSFEVHNTIMVVILNFRYQGVMMKIDSYQNIMPGTAYRLVNILTSRVRLRFYDLFYLYELK